VKIIDDLLDWSRLNTGKLPLKLEAVDLRAIVERIADAAALDAKTKGIAFEVAVTDELIVNADAVRLEQIVWNLVNNATKFTPSGGTVNVRALEQDGRAVLIVEDTGDGIEPAFLPHVFEMFRQSQRGDVRSNGGMGIGLALVKRLVDMHGGEVEARSPGPGQGSTFTIRLPMFDAPRDENPPELAAQRLDGLRVLLVDQDHDARNALERLLTLAGARVASADSERAAVVTDSTSVFDAVVVDVTSAGTDALSLVRTIRERVAPASVVAVAISGRSTEMDRTAAIRAGFDEFMSRPVDVDRMVEILSRGMGDPQQAAESLTVHQPPGILGAWTGPRRQLPH
jgi:two-component system, chemotaxis family, CheB/CheR fusion protein